MKKTKRNTGWAKWDLPRLVIAAAILIALVASIPVGSYLKAQILIQDQILGN
ncbi:MAG: hypothetical protein AAB551_03890 [Patescibacteria group bacterium]